MILYPLHQDVQDRERLKLILLLSEVVERPGICA